MIGTEEGCWFSLAEQADGLVNYEFYRDELMLESGQCADEDVIDRFDAFVAAIRGHVH